MAGGFERVSDCRRLCEAAISEVGADDSLPLMPKLAASDEDCPALCDCEAVSRCPLEAPLADAAAEEPEPPFIDVVVARGIRLVESDTGDTGFATGPLLLSLLRAPPARAAEEDEEAEGIEGDNRCRCSGHASGSRDGVRKLAADGEAVIVGIVLRVPAVRLAPERSWAEFDWLSRR